MNDTSTNPTNTTTTTTTTTIDESTTTLPLVEDNEYIQNGWFYERQSKLWNGQCMGLQVRKILYHQKSLYQDILVFQSISYGNVLVLDGIIQVTEYDEYSYQEMITHIPLYSHPNPTNILCIGGGDGGVIREICKHSTVQSITICEIDQDVITVSQQFLPNVSCCYNDPRVTVYIGDGYEYIQQHTNEYDVIITDSSDPIGPGCILFETPYYTAMYHALKHEGGIICSQGECMWLHTNMIQQIISSISTIYDSVEYAYTTIPTYPCGQIGFIIATKHMMKSNSHNTAAIDTITTTTNTNQNHSNDSMITTTTTLQNTVNRRHQYNQQYTCQIPIRQPTDQIQQTLKYYTPQIHMASFILPHSVYQKIYSISSSSTSSSRTSTDKLIQES